MREITSGDAMQTARANVRAMGSNLQAAGEKANVKNIASTALDTVLDAPRTFGAGTNKLLYSPGGLLGGFETKRLEQDQATDQQMAELARRRGNTKLANQYTSRISNQIKQNYGTDALNEARRQMIGGGVRTATTIAGLGSPGALAGQAVIGGVLGGGIAAITGEDVSTGIGKGIGSAPQYAGLNRITNPFFQPLTNSVFARGVAGNFMGRFASGGITNLVEDEVYTRLAEQRPPTMSERAFSVIAGGLGNAIFNRNNTTRALARIDKKGALTINFEAFNDTVPQLRKEFGLEDRDIQQIRTFLKKVADMPVGLTIKEVPGASKPQSTVETTAPKKSAAEITAEKITGKEVSLKQETPKIENAPEPAPLMEKAPWETSSPLTEAGLVPEPGIETPAGVARPIKEIQIKTDAQSLQEAEASTMGSGGKINFIEPLSNDIRQASQEWVNRRGAGKIINAETRLNFSEYDSLGMKAFDEIQSGKNLDRYKAAREFLDNQYQLSVEAGYKTNYRQNFLPQMWADGREAVEKVFGKRLSLNPSFTMKRIISDYKTGMKADLTPKYKTLGELLGAYAEQVNRAVVDAQYFRTLAENSLIAPQGKGLKGWVVLDPERFPKITSKIGKETFTNTNYTAPENLAKFINNYLKDPTEGTLASIARFASQTKQVALTAGVPYTGINAHGVNILARYSLSGNLPKNFIQGSGWIVNPRKAGNIVEGHLKSGFARKMSEAGMTLGAEGVGIDIPDDMGFGIQWKGLSNAIEKPLFNKILPAAKLNIAHDVYSGLIKDGYGEKEALRAAAEIANGVMGGKNLAEIGRSVEFQNLLRSTILAPDWSETQIEMGKGIFKTFFKKGSPQSKIYSKIMGNLIFTYILANVWNKVNSGRYMVENPGKRKFDVMVGYTNDGKERYLNLFGTAIDFVRLPAFIALALFKGEGMNEISSTITNRFSIPASVVSNLLITNENWRGQAIYGKDKYGNKLGVVKSAGGIVSELSRLILMPQIPVTIEYLTGRISLEEYAAKMVEAPLRYRGGAYSNTQKEFEDMAKKEGLTGKELFDFRENLSGQTLGENQKAYVREGGISALNQVIADKRAKQEFKAATDPQEKNLLEKIFGGKEAQAAEESDKIYYRVGEDVKVVDIGRVRNLPEQTYAQKAVKEREKWFAVDNIVRSELTEQQKIKAIESLGVKPEEATYHFMATRPSEVKYGYLLDEISTMKSKDEIMSKLISFRNEVGGQKILTDTLVNRLYDEGVINANEKSVLKAYKWNKATKKLGYSGVRGKKMSMPKLTPLKFSTPAKIKLHKPKAIKVSKRRPLPPPPKINLKVKRG